MRSSQLQIPANLDYLDGAASFVDAVTARFGFSAAAAAEVHLGLEEIFTNIVRHGFNGNPDAVFRICCEELPSALVLTFYAQGVPFDPARMPQYQPQLLGETGDTRGLGTFLVRSVMDSVEFENLGRDGYAIRLIKKLGESSAAEEKHQQISAAGVQDPAGKEKISPADLTIREMRPEEAIGVSQCAFESYGYTYEDYIYQPEMIVEYNREGRMCSLVAVTGEGHVAAHIALERESSTSRNGELGVLFVRHAFRGQGLAGIMLDHAVKKAREIGLDGLYGRVVAGHDLSQKLLAHLGFDTCGILLGIFPKDVQFKALTGVVKEKMTGFLQWAGLTHRPARQIYPPDCLQEPIAECYRALKLDIDCAAHPAIAPLSAATELAVDTIKVLNIAVISLHRYGKDPVREVRKALRRLCLNEASVIHLHLDLENPATAVLYPAFSDLGFFFAGILPYGLDGKDCLILQYLNNLRISYEHLHLLTPQGERLLSFVKSEDPVLRDLNEEEES